MVGVPRTADDGGVIHLTAPGTGERATVAVLPFLSHRYAARAAELVTQTPAENNAQYDDMVRSIRASLAGGFRPDAVNVVLAHLTVVGGAWGGGEREAQSVIDYVVDPAAFPADAHYVALGHLHRRQHVPAPCPAVHYRGSPLNIDFGEEDNPSVALLVEAAAGVPASVTELPVKSAVRLRTVSGTVADLVARGAAGEFGDDLLRVVVAEKPFAGLREAIADALPNALEVRIDAQFQVQRGGPRTVQEAGLDRRPTELFAEFLSFRGPRRRIIHAAVARANAERGLAGRARPRVVDVAGLVGFTRACVEAADRVVSLQQQRTDADQTVETAAAAVTEAEREARAAEQTRVTAGRPRAECAHGLARRP